MPHADASSPPPRIGSLFSGYGGLDLAVESFYSAHTVWHAEIDKHASAVLAANWPGVPNLGDISALDWSDVPPVDILTGGFPCQDISQAGKGAGIKEGTRSGLWFRMHDAVRCLRPGLVVVENVSRLRSRGLDIVLGQMAEIGYDCRWVSLRASDVGAPHRRDRLFLTFYPQDTPHPSRSERGDSQLSGVGEAPGSATEPGECSGTCAGVVPLAYAAGEGLQGVTERQVQHVVATPYRQDVPADTRGERHGRGQDGGEVGLVGGRHEGEAQERERPREVPVDRGPATQGAWAEGATADRGSEAPDFGPYADAVARWEPIIGRPAPPPTIPGQGDRPQLSHYFVEWMMGLTEGWVTDHLDRRPALKALGNGVVPQQAYTALEMLDAAR